MAYGTYVPARSVITRDPGSLLVPAAESLPSNAEYLAHLDVAGSGDGLIRLASNENTEPPSPLVRKALERSFEDANLSPPPNPPVRAELAERFGVTPDRILVGAGSTELIEAALRTFVRAGDEVILPTPSWPVFERRLTALEARIVRVQMTAQEHSYAYDVEGLLDAVSERTKVLIVCSPNNPTGNSMTLEDVRRCAERAPLLLVDAAYADFDPAIDLSPLVHEHANVILTRTFSKAYCMAGLRLGYAVGDAEVFDYVDRCLVPGSSVSSAALHAGLAALRDEDYHDRQVERIRAERARLLAGIRELGLIAYESRGNFVAVDASAYDGGATGLVAAVLKGGVVIRRMTATIARISVGTASENEILLKALRNALKSSARPS